MVLQDHLKGFETRCRTVYNQVGGALLLSLLQLVSAMVERYGIVIPDAVLPGLQSVARSLDSHFTADLKSRSKVTDKEPPRMTSTIKRKGISVAKEKYGSDEDIDKAPEFKPMLSKRPVTS